MLFDIYIYLIIFGLLIRRSKWLTNIIFIYCWVLMGLNTYNLDFYNYETFYNNIGYSKYIDTSLEIGYYYISKFLKTFGFDYVIAKSILAAICLFIYCKFIKKNTPYPSFVAALYLGFILPREVIQVRFFYASALVLLAFMCLLKKNTFKNVLGASLLILSAITVHSAMIFFVLLLLAYMNFKEMDNTIKIFIISICGFLLLIFLVVLMQEGGLFMVKGESYMSNVVSVISSLFFMGITAVLYLFNKKTLDKTIVTHGSWEVLFSRLNFVILLISPLFIFTASMGRLTRFFIFINIVYYSRRILGKHSFRYSSLVLMLSVLSFSIAFFMHIVSFRNEYLNVFDNNLLLKECVIHNRYD